MLELLDVYFEDYDLWGKKYREYTARNAFKCNCGCGGICLDGDLYIQGHGPRKPYNRDDWSGPNSPGWKGGISFEPYCYKFNNKFKEKIREQFNRVCFLCGKSERKNGKKLAIHHVNYDKNCLCTDIKCGFVPLCMGCHVKTNHNRDFWEKKIMKMITELEVNDEYNL